MFWCVQNSYLMSREQNAYCGLLPENYALVMNGFCISLLTVEKAWLQNVVLERLLVRNHVKLQTLVRRYLRFNKSSPGEFHASVWSQVGRTKSVIGIQILKIVISLRNRLQNKCKSLWCAPQDLHDLQSSGD